MRSILEHFFMEIFITEGDETKAAVRSNTLIDIVKSNNHYVDLENGGYKLKDVLVRVEAKCCTMAEHQITKRKSFSKSRSCRSLTTRALWVLMGLLVPTDEL